MQRLSYFSGSARLLAFFMLLTFPVLTGCGTVAHQSTDSNTPAPSTSDGSDTGEILSTLYMFATDYESSGQLYRATASTTATTLTNTGLSYLGSSAIIRVFDGLVYILHDGFSSVSSDNLQIVDPQNNFATLSQCSTGNGTNPHDVLVANGRVFITLYNPGADPDNEDAQGRPGDVIELDMDSCEIVRSFSFQSYLAADGDLNANADRMVLAGNMIYVALQDLASNTFAADSNGLIGMIDTGNNTVHGAIALSGRNPVSLMLNSDASRLLVADMATYDVESGNFNTFENYGGIEVVDLATEQSLTLIHDDFLGGYVERLARDGEELYAVISTFNAGTFSFSSRIISAPETADGSSDFAIRDNSGTDIREMAIDNDLLWVSRREINQQTGLSDPLLEAVQLSTGDRVGEALVPAAPGMSLAAGGSL